MENDIDDLPYEGWTNWHTWHVHILMNNIYDYYIAYWEHMQKHGKFKSVEEFRSYVAGLFEMKTKEKERYDEDIDFNKVDWQELFDHVNNAYDENERYDLYVRQTEILWAVLHCSCEPGWEQSCSVPIFR